MFKPARILLIEDDVVDQLAFKRMVKEQDLPYDYTIASTITEARKLLEGESFDLIVTDYSLGDSTPFEIFDLITETPTIFATGAGDEATAVKAMKLGAYDYLIKDQERNYLTVLPLRVDSALRQKEAEVALLESEERYRDLFENATDLIQSVAPDGSILYVNQAWMRTLGYEAEDIESLNIFDIIHPGSVEHCREVLRSAKCGESIKTIEAKFVTRDGRVIVVEGNSSNRFVDGKLAATRGIFRDVTERRNAEDKLRRSELRFRSLSACSPIGIFQTDHTGQCTYVNTRWQEISGLNEAQSMGDGWCQAIDPEDRSRVQALWQESAENTKEFSIEFRVRTPDDQCKHVCVVARPMVLSETVILGHVGTVEDVTQRKASEAKMLGIQSELATTNEDLVTKNEEIQGFYHTLSHELKTPLTAVQEFTSIVLDGLAGVVNDTQKEYLDIALQSSRQLQVCINDLLDTTRIETGKFSLELKPASLSKLVQRVVAVAGAPAGERQIHLEAEIDPNIPEVVFDESRINQVITNLLNNALKFTSAGGTVTVRAAMLVDRPGQVEVSVADTGRGIPEEQRARIFDRLYQVNSGDAANGKGVGLGLYICQELVRMHGGQLRVESVAGEGSTFSFAIPLTPLGAKPRLLIVEDDAELREWLCLIMEEHNYDVSSASEGGQALEMMHDRVPSVVLMDLKMNGMDGLTTLKHIRQNWGAIPVIIHTGHVDDLMTDALAYSPLTLLAKPCPIDRLLDTVGKVLRSADTEFLVAPKKEKLVA